MLKTLRPTRHIGMSDAGWRMRNEMSRGKARDEVERGHVRTMSATSTDIWHAICLHFTTYTLLIAITCNAFCILLPHMQVYTYTNALQKKTKKNRKEHTDDFRIAPLSARRNMYIYIFFLFSLVYILYVYAWVHKKYLNRYETFIIYVVMIHGQCRI